VIDKCAIVLQGKAELLSTHNHFTLKKEKILPTSTITPRSHHELTTPILYDTSVDRPTLIYERR
jgi:hypothetical protein